MEILKSGAAGTLESGDITVEISPGVSGVGGIEIDVESPVMSIFGEQIRRVIHETAAGLGVASADIRAFDRGALDCTIRARVTAAVYRAAGRDDYNFK
jgi:citrate lyase subunit gamma (acyl carrier protein)